MIKDIHSFSAMRQKSSEDEQFEFTLLTGSIVVCGIFSFSWLGILQKYGLKISTILTGSKYTVFS